MTNDKKYGNLIQNLPEAIYTCDPMGVIKLYNKAAINLWGREPVAGKDLWCGSGKMFNKDGGNLTVDKYPMTMALKQSRPIYGEEIIVQRPDGSVKHVNPYCSPLFNSNGELTGVVSMLIEVSKKIDRERRSEEKYKTLIEQASDAILIYSFDGTIYEFNKSCYTLLGYSREEYASLKLNDILLGDIVVDQANYTAIQAGNVKTVYRHLKRKDGSLLEAEVTIKMLADGKAIAFARDITERKKAEQALRESKVFNQSILKSITSHIAVVEENGCIISVNKAWSDFSEKNGERVLERTGTGSNYIEVCEKSAAAGDITAAKALKGFRQVIQKEIPFFEMEYPCDVLNEKYWFLLRITNFADDSLKVVMMHIDITERVKAGTNMHEALERYDILTKATSDTIWDWDIVNNSIVYNNVITKMFGYQTTQIKNELDWWKRNIHPEDLQRVAKLLEEVFTSRTHNFQVEYRFRCQDKSYKHVFDRAFVIFNEHGKPHRMIGAMQDISERKKSEKEVEDMKQQLMYQKVEEQKKITRAVLNAQEKERRHMGEELHDNINQMLAGTKLYLSAALNNNKELKQALEYPMQLIDDTMKEIRLLTKRSVTPQQNINLEELVQCVLDTMEKNTTIKTSFNYTIPHDFNDDDLKLNIYRIIQEQSANIIKHANAGTVSILMARDNNVVKIAVTDDGVGFDINAKREGIGISNIINRVQSFNGEVKIESAPAKGCKLIIAIPVNN